MKQLLKYLWKLVAASSVAAFLMLLNAVSSQALAAADLRIIDAYMSTAYERGGTNLHLREGEVVNAAVQLYNYGDEGAELAGPIPTELTTTYEEGESFLSKGYGLETGKYRFGIDFSNSHDIAGITYPYRMGGTFADGTSYVVQPGQSIWLAVAFKPRRLGENMPYSFGLVKEGERWIQDHVFQHNLTVVDDSGRILPQTYSSAEITNFTYSLTPWGQSVDMNVWFTVKNTGTKTLYSQAPVTPGFGYHESISFRDLGYGFRELKGLFRVGVDFAGSHDKLGITYPWRWGYDGYILPGEEVVIHGKVVFSEPKTLTIWAGAVIEGEKWMSEGNRQEIIVPPVVEIPISIPVSTPISTPISVPISIPVEEALGYASNILPPIDWLIGRDRDNSGDGDVADNWLPPYYPLAYSPLVADDTDSPAFGDNTQEQILDDQGGNSGTNSDISPPPSGISVSVSGGSYWGTAGSSGGTNKYGAYSPVDSAGVVNREKGIIENVLDFLGTVVRYVFPV